MIAKLPRYRLTFGYILPENKDRIQFGTLDEMIFTFKEVEYFLKVLSPVNSANWIQYISMLRRGCDYLLTFNETTDRGVTKKVLKITRN